MRFALLALLAACGTTAPAGPIVKIVYDQEGIPDDVLTYANAGANAWSSLGVDGGSAVVGTRQDNVECLPNWYDGQLLPCTLTIHMSFAAASSLGGKAGLTANRHSQIAYELAGDQLTSVVAHEVGHSLWNTSEHLPAGEIGIMASAAQGVSPTDADIAFAIEHTNSWIQP